MSVSCFWGLSGAWARYLNDVEMGLSIGCSLRIIGSMVRKAICKVKFAIFKPFLITFGYYNEPLVFYIFFNIYY